MISIRVKRALCGIKLRIKSTLVECAMRVIRWAEKDSSYVAHAEREFKALGWPGTCEMQAEVCKGLKDMLCVFSSQGHSGLSASYMLGRFQLLADFKPLGPLTGEGAEWQEVGEGLWQNRRCSRVFKGEDGRAYDIEGKVFREPDGCCFTSEESHVYVDFPYTPKTEYVEVPASA